MEFALALALFFMLGCAHDEEVVVGAEAGHCGHGT